VVAAVVGLVGYAVWTAYAWALLGSFESFYASLSLTKLAGLCALGLVGVWIALLSTFFQSGVLALPVGEAYLEGHTSLEGIMGKLPLGRLIVVCLLGATLVTAGLVLVVPGFYLLINLALVPIVAVAERRGPWAALKRSRELVRSPMPPGIWNNNITRIVVILVFLTILELLLLSVQLGLRGIAAKLLGARAAMDALIDIRNPVLPLWAAVTLGIVEQLITAFVRPFALCAFMLLYYDIRLRKEGLDIEFMLRRLESAKAPRQQSESWRK